MPEAEKTLRGDSPVEAGQGQGGTRAGGGGAWHVRGVGRGLRATGTGTADRESQVSPKERQKYEAGSLR